MGIAYQGTPLDSRARSQSNANPAIRHASIAVQQERHRMRFSNFLFPDSASAHDDGRVIDETLQEAILTDQLGYDTIWLAEHHFDGICAYVDPVSFAAALATATHQARIGFAVAQMALHHPIRMA